MEASTSGFIRSPIVRPAPVVSYRQDRHGVAVHLVAHRVREASQYPLAIASLVSGPTEWCIHQVVNCVKDFGTKTICGKFVPFAVPTKRFGNVALGCWSENDFKVAHKAFRRARTSPQGTACTAPERSSSLR